mmetsp:Transcript_13941/g.19533  ORF Transcript_13941/g.19533 Transcript_13941/m.19533 type:complete len:436 (-) Transcript_13941:141-1448(-)
MFGGIPEYVDCADRLDTYFGNCSEVRICVPIGSSSHDLFADSVADFNLRPVPIGDFYEMFIKGKCNVIAGASTAIAEMILRNEGYTGDYKLGETIFLKEPYSMVTREDDKKWSDFVNWVFRSLLAAEEQNITHNTASKFMTTTVFGEKYKDMFVNAIQAVGNYGDIYRRHMEDFVPRDNLKSNLLNNGSTGLHFAYPLGEPTESPDPIAGSTTHSITKKEGKLRCGIFDREGFGKEIVSTTARRWQGMDADYCYALSASLFEGSTNKVVFVHLANFADSFQALENGLVDVVAGVPLTLEGDVNETSTGKGYTFSIPYFYGDANGPLVQDNVSETPEGALSLVTREDDSQWSDFVFWVVSATFIAEEEYITQKISKDMVGVSAFGPSFVNMHRHTIGAVGNYGEIYSRNVESIVPRQGRNLLNSNPFGPQHWSFFG